MISGGISLAVLLLVNKGGRLLTGSDHSDMLNRTTASLRCRQNDCLLKRNGHRPCKPDADCCIEDGSVYRTPPIHSYTVDTLRSSAHLYAEIVEFLFL